jgi:hypothetical protein
MTYGKVKTHTSFEDVKTHLHTQCLKQKLDPTDKKLMLDAPAGIDFQIEVLQNLFKEHNLTDRPYYVYYTNVPSWAVFRYELTQEDLNKLGL